MLLCIKGVEDSWKKKWHAVHMKIKLVAHQPSPPTSQHTHGHTHACAHAHTNLRLDNTLEYYKILESLLSLSQICFRIMQAFMKCHIQIVVCLMSRAANELNLPSYKLFVFVYLVKQV